MKDDYDDSNSRNGFCKRVGTRLLFMDEGKLLKGNQKRYLQILKKKEHVFLSKYYKFDILLRLKNK